MTMTIDLDTPYALTEEHIAFYRENGFIKLKQVLSQEALDYYGQAITDYVLEQTRGNTPLGERDTYGKAFLQVGNIWAQSETAKEFAFSKRMARIAAELMEVDGVRMYHDQALYKEPSGGITPWHADQYYWPLSTEKTVTAWIPLQETPLDMGPLAFAPKSHTLEGGRHLEISDESEVKIQEMLKSFDMDYEESQFDAGEVSFHAGWTYHRAGANSTDKPRRVMTVIYMDKDIKRIDSQRPAHVGDSKHWLPGVEVGEVCNSELNPILWEKDA